MKINGCEGSYIKSYGRARPKDNGFVFDYFIKDHLGNTRMVLTDEQQTDAYPVASMETATAASEKLYYTNIDETRADKPAGYPEDTYTQPNDKVAKLNANSKKIGPAILLKVMSGDQMNIRANAYYRLNGGSAGSPSNPASELLAALAGSLQGATMNKYGMFQIQNSGVLGPGITDLLQRQTDQYAGSTRPKAYLNWVLLDEQFKIVNSSSGFEQVGADGEFKTFVKTGLPISQNGYLYVYTSNESPVYVFFDNLQVTHVRGPLLEETHYYPFGLTMAGISSKGASFGGAENKLKFNDGTEFESKEFSDGSGLDLYFTEFRSYDPQIGRFHQIDPLGEVTDNWSPYSFVQNNPILYNDPLGLDTLKRNADGSLPTVRPDGSKLQENDVILNGKGPSSFFNGEGWAEEKVLEEVVVTGSTKKKDDSQQSNKPWLDIAFNENAKDVKEISGSKANPDIIKYHKSTGGFKSDEIPWCSSFVNYCMNQSGNKGTNSASALSWRKWGQGSSVPLNGSVAVINWGGGKGHVGFVVGKKGAYIALLGGNQGDRMKVALFKQSLIQTYRLPSNYIITKQDSILKTINGSINDFKGTR